MAPRSYSPTTASAELAKPEPLLKLLPPCPHLRRLMLALPKHALLDVASHWLHHANALPHRRIIDHAAASTSANPDSVAPHVIPPLLARSASTSTASRADETQRAADVTTLRLLYSAPDALPNPSVSRARVVQRILDVDWARGITPDMIAMLACRALHEDRNARRWSAVQLLDADEKATLQMRHAHTLASRLSSELRHYFPSHHLHLDVPPPFSPSSHHLDGFVTMRVVLPHSATTLCSPNALVLLCVPGQPLALLSGTMGRSGGAHANDMVLAALAACFGASDYRASVRGGGGGGGGGAVGVGRPPSGTKERRRRYDDAAAAAADDDDDDEANWELTSSDPASLRDVLLRTIEAAATATASATHGRHAAGVGGGAVTPTPTLGGSQRAMRHGRAEHAGGGAEDGPLVRAARRRRERGEDVSLVYSAGVAGGATAAGAHADADTAAAATAATVPVVLSDAVERRERRAAVALCRAVRLDEGGGGGGAGGAQDVGNGIGRHGDDDDGGGGGAGAGARPASGETVPSTSASRPRPRPPPHVEARVAKRRLLRRAERMREARELFGPLGVDDGGEGAMLRGSGGADEGPAAGEGGGGRLERFERVDYELHLPIPSPRGYGAVPAYSTTKRGGSGPRTTGSVVAPPLPPPIQLRLQGTHVLEGLRRVVASGMDRLPRGSSALVEETSKTTTRRASGGGNRRGRGRGRRAGATRAEDGDDEGDDDDGEDYDDEEDQEEEEEEEEERAQREARSGLPGWLTQVRGTRVVVGQQR